MTRYRFTVSLILCLVLQTFCHSQYSELKEHGLKGKVKKMTRYHYQSSTPNSEIDSLLWISKSIYYFNIKGNIDSIVNCTNYKNYLHSIDLPTVHSITVNHYDGTGKKITGYYIGDRSKNEKEFIQYKWLNAYTYKESTYYPHTNQPKTEITTFLNHNYRDSAGVSLYYDTNNKLIYDDRYTSFYNQQNQLVSFIEAEVHSNTLDTIDVNIISNDTYENPTKYVMVKKSYPEVYSIYFRQYEYYKD